MSYASTIPYSYYPDRHLWRKSAGIASLIFAAFSGVVSFGVFQLGWGIKPQERAKPREESVTVLILDPASKSSGASEATMPQKVPFARTSEDQPKSTERHNEFIGERSTQATSDRPADPTAEALPSQFGVEPKPGEIETTESRYQDGELIPATPSSLLPDATAGSPPPTPSTVGDALANPAAQENPNQNISEELTSNPSEERTPPPLRETLLDGPNPVEVEVPIEEGLADQPRQTPTLPENLSKVPDASALPTTETSNPTETISETPRETSTTPAAPRAFQGNQRKTAMVGSISRTGRSALNVDDTELGRYQAAIGKAVELEWQRNCVRNRDLITPGFLTVRFFVEPSGRVRTVDFVGEMDTGEIQKGFTLSAIRDAAIPEMPDTLAKSFEGDTLELVFRFHF